MPEESEDMLPCERELVAGFSAQTLSYPDKYELPRLGNERKMRLERAVALEIDSHNRVKRCRMSDGYVHETLMDNEWQECKRFGSLQDVLDSDILAVARRKHAEPSPEIDEHD
ncbi:MAG: hypothetical protein A2283_10865 [Lentisphaerae bacterium RIFOXYA12_FULL_48_11]|nr:MAG: hypothetical protein A2283_10865 [Lentisphaerae bacterium RIFOXYA12_FULL_48_11]